MTIGLASEKLLSNWKIQCGASDISLPTPSTKIYHKYAVTSDCYCLRAWKYLTNDAKIMMFLEFPSNTHCCAVAIMLDHWRTRVSNTEERNRSFWGPEKNGRTRTALFDSFVEAQFGDIDCLIDNGDKTWRFENIIAQAKWMTEIGWEHGVRLEMD